KLEGRGYAPNKYVSSFVGFAPASAPRLIVAVMIDEPAGGQYYGGAVAAPVFSTVLGAAPPQRPVPALCRKLGWNPRRTAADRGRVGPGVAFAAYPGHAADGRKFVPDAIARGA